MAGQWLWKVESLAAWPCLPASSLVARPFPPPYTLARGWSNRRETGLPPRHPPLRPCLGRCLEVSSPGLLQGRGGFECSLDVSALTPLLFFCMSETCRISKLNNVEMLVNRHCGKY